MFKISVNNTLHTDTRAGDRWRYPAQSCRVCSFACLLASDSAATTVTKDISNSFYNFANSTFSLRIFHTLNWKALNLSERQNAEHTPLIR